MPHLALLLLLAGFTSLAHAQFDEDQLGGWYAYQWTVNREGSSIGFQGDFQHRNWDVGGDLEQLLARGGVTSRVQLGYMHQTLDTASKGQLLLNWIQTF